MKNILGLTIRKERRARDISQEQLADILDVGQSYIASVEKGRKVPTMEMAVQMAKELNIKDIKNLVIASKIEKTLAPTGSTISIKDGYVIIDTSNPPVKKSRLSNS